MIARVQRLRPATPFLLAAALIALAFPALRHYGVNWDEALGDFFFGDRYLSYFTGTPERSMFASAPFRSYPWEYPPVAATMAAATSRALTALGLTDPFDGFHALNILLGGIVIV